MEIGDKIPDRLADADALAIGGDPTDSMATLCIYADDLDPESVTEVVGCSPTTARRKGERFVDRPKPGPARIGQWFLKAPEILSFVEKIEFLLNSTTDADDQWRSLADSYCLELRAAIFLRSWTEGFELSNDTLARISRRKWSFSLSMYSAEGEEIVDSFLRRSPPAEDANDG